MSWKTRLTFGLGLKRILVLLLISSLIFQSLLFNVATVYAASSPWTQTDWSGGSGQTSWSDATKYSSASNVTTSTAGQATLTNTEELSNTGFESDLSSWSEVPSYTLNDQFTTDRAAGAVNGTSAEPTGGTRTVIDTNSKLSLSSGVANFATGGVGTSDPGLWYASQARLLGRVGLVKINYTALGMAFGWDANQTGGITDQFRFNDTVFQAGGITVGTVSTSTVYQLASVMRASGIYYFIKGGAFTNWTLVWSSASGTAAAFLAVAAAVTTAAVFTADNVRIPTATWVPTPLAYDTFTRADGAVGSSETTGPDSQSTSALTWTGGAISGNTNVITPTLESDVIVNGGFATDTNWTKEAGWTISGGVAVRAVTTGSDIYQANILTVGRWYQAVFEIISYVAGTFKAVFGSTSGPTYTSTGVKTSTNRAGTSTLARIGANVSADGTVDNVSFRPLTLSSLFSTVATSDSDVIADANVTLTTDTQAGLVTNLDSTSSPANFLIAYHDGTNVKLDKNVGGTYTNLISAVTTYSAGATLRVITYHSDATTLKVRVYYNNALVGSEQTVTDAGVRENTKHGLFSTYSGNSFDNFTLWARGTGAEYTDAPFEELTPTRDTGTKYAGAASAKLVAGGTDANYLQSVNVGDTNTYNVSAYAYTDGSAVTSSDLSLYYDAATISTTYTSVGGGWYQLTGTLTGAASAKNYGVRVKAGKTVYLDDASLNNYTSGTLTSSIFDTGQGSNWGTLTYSATTPTNTSVAVKARTSNDSGMSGATAFASCTAITSGADISSNTCITDTHRYIQYELTLANTVTTVTPTFQDISIVFVVSDATAPAISLNALTPDPNSDNTPTLNGTATEAIGTVSAVQFQMDSTSGSWSSCTADDGVFDEASETFGCTAATLTDGSHTMYVRATDSNGNTTDSSSYSSDTFTIDATNPISIDLDSPGDNSYTNNARPTFKWKATTDATSGLSKYVLDIDNGMSGDFNIDNIPTSGTSDYETSKYVIHFDNFSDSDSTNNYISVYTRSTSSGQANGWSTDSNSGQNDGKLKEGIRNWTVTAYDSAGNSKFAGRTLFVDLTGPNLEINQINATPFNGTSFSTTDKTPTLYGKITDHLSSADGSTQAQTENGPKIASGPKNVEIRIEKLVGLVYQLHTLFTISMDKSYYVCDGHEVTDNTKNKCDKYVPFEFTSPNTLDYGTYRITLGGKDKADNSASQTVFSLRVNTLAQITTSQEKEIIKEEIEELSPDVQEHVQQELEVTKPASESPLAWIFNLLTNIFNAFNQITNSALAFIGQQIQTGIAYLQLVNQELALAFNSATHTISSGLAYVTSAIGYSIELTVGSLGQGLASTGRLIAFLNQTTQSLLSSTGEAIGDGYSRLAENAPGVVGTMLTAVGTAGQNVASGLISMVNNFAVASTEVTHSGGVAIVNITNGIANTTVNTTKNTLTRMESDAKSTQDSISNLAFGVGEKVQVFSDRLGLAIIKFTYNFVSEPTTIFDVQVVTLTPTTAKISWHTNHPATGKVNYGLDDTYQLDIQTSKRNTYHEFTLTDLKPGTEYHFEVMSQNKNYVYDANRRFTTPKE